MLLWLSWHCNCSINCFKLKKGATLMRNKLFLSISAIVLSFTIASNADVIKITGVTPGSYENVTIEGSLLPLSGPDVNGGVCTGLYDAIDVTTGVAWKTYCIDPIGDITLESQWNANLLTGADLQNGTAGVLSTPAYGSTALVTKQKYDMIGYLANKYYYDLSAANPMAISNNSDAAKSARSDLSLAFWEISRDFDGTGASLNLQNGNFKVTSGSLTYAQGLLNDALTNYKLNDNYNLTVFSPTQRPSQEFIAFRQVPEPGTLSLMGLSLLGILGFVSFRRKK
jgi:hypothetical protein